MDLLVVYFDYSSKIGVVWPIRDTPAIVAHKHEAASESLEGFRESCNRVDIL